MADIISLLPDHVANQIAAGEVIQRPASVVKELLENAIDAKSSHIQLLIKDSGKTLIQVIDDGIGMSPNDIRLAFERHATSKIKTAEDLFSITSMGFRGEALASIAAIAHVETHTRTEEDEMATCLKIAGSKVESQELSVSPKGTSIAVKNLFYNIPARRNFLKSDNVEFRHVIDEFHRVAIAHPEIKFTFYQNGSELFDLPAGIIRKRIANIFANKIEEKLIPVEEMTSVAGIEGFIVKPDFSKKSRGQQFIFVNNRFIKSPFLHHAISSAYLGLLRDGYQPGYFLFLQVDPKSIDINIHPTKTEIKFEDDQNLFAIIKSMVKHSLGMFQAFPSLDFDRDPLLDTPYAFRNKDHQGPPPIEINSSFNPFHKKEGEKNKFIVESWESLYSDLEIPESESDSNEELKLDITHSPKVFQLFNKYIVTSLRSGLLIMDQKRAHQRVLYETFLKGITQRDILSQQLLFPREIQLTHSQIALFEGYQENLHAVGFVTQLSNNKIVITGVPAICNDKQLNQLFEDVFASTEQETPLESFSQADFISKVIAKSLSIKSGKDLSIIEQQALVDDLFACKETLLSPFDRQIFVTLDKEELENKLN